MRVSRSFPSPMRSLVPLILFALSSVALTPIAEAQVSPYLGYNTQHETPVYGVAYREPFGTLALVPSVEAGLGSGEDYVQASADMTVDLTRHSQFVPYVGVGLTAGRIPMNGETKIRAGGNAIVGVRFAPMGAVVPYAQLRYTNVAGGDAVTAMAGAALRF